MTNHTDTERKALALVKTIEKRVSIAYVTDLTRMRRMIP